MRVHVLGDGTLADTTRICCLPYHELAETDIDVLWCCVDTPIVDDRGDAESVARQIRKGLAAYDPPLVLISSQVPVGFCAEMERRYPGYDFAVSPENIRVKTGVQDFLNQTRIVVGTRREHDPVLEALLSPFCDRLLWMTPESAEMVKHALNGYLAMCIRFGNEIGALCETVGADPDAVIAALRAERRVADTAPLLPGDPPSQHLMRDVNTLAALSPFFTAFL